MVLFFSIFELLNLIESENKESDAVTTERLSLDNLLLSALCNNESDCCALLVIEKNKTIKKKKENLFNLTFYAFAKINPFDQES